MEIYNIWDLEGVFIQIDSKFFEGINKKLFEKFKTKPQAHKSIFTNQEYKYPIFKNMLKVSYPKKWFLPLDFLMKICEALDIDKEELQRNIVAYKSWGSVNYIEKPKLPIVINPVFDMVYAHNIGDGTVSVSKGKSPYFAYRQFNAFYREAYIKKIEFIFGEIKLKKKEFKDFTRVRCPSALSSLFFKYYNLTDRGFLSDVARIDTKIYEKGSDSMLAVLIAFIIDEGCVDSTQITIVLKNKPLVEDLNKICTLLGYESKVYYKKGDYEKYTGLGILRKGMKNLYSDYLELNMKYPVIDMGIKGERIRKSFEIYNRKVIRIKGNQKLILNMLKSENLSVNQLADKLNMTRQGIRYHIHNLLNNDKIRIIDKTELNWTYGV